VSPDQLPEVLGRIARVVAESLDLKDVFARVAEAAADVLPYDNMIVMRAEPGDVVVLHAFVGTTAGKPADARLDEFSPGLREILRTGGRIDDLAAVLDMSFPLDRRTHEDGMRSCIAVPIRRAGRMDAIVAVASRRVRAFTDEHEAALRMIADLVGLALEHERLWTLDAARRRRLDAVDALLPAIAQALDVRAIFNQVSTIVRPVLAHDRLMLASLSEDRRTVTVDALSGEPVPDLSRTTAAPERCSTGLILEPEVVPDIEADAGSADRCERARILGVRAMLRIPMRLPDGRIGALIFLAKTPGTYSDEDVVVARRVTDYVSLALSHQRLAEEERLAAEASDRAARLEERVAELREALDTSRGFRRVVGESAAWTDVLEQAAKVAPTETTVLLTGESGTGKEVVARLIHGGSARAKGPFVALNCAALQETLLESELFGHEKGAFTGATSAHTGSIEQAAGGVLFLDEVGEMTRPVQAKLLRVLQEREFQRLGSTKPMRADVRVVAATNRDLSSAIARGEFREDLYYRLHVFEIHLPPLRERRDDVLALAETFLDEVGHAVGRPAAGISKDAREVLLAYSWPGNVRELRNVLERATILCEGGLITAEHLPRELGRRAPAAPPAASPAAAPSAPASAFPTPPTIAFNLDEVERDAIVRALEAAGNNRSQAARLLGIARPQLYHRLKKFGLGGAATNGDPPPPGPGSGHV
jgi:transcriptional regulator with GAF, ATPase, and Fis domain